MKPLRILLLGVVCSVILFSCNEPDDDPITREPVSDDPSTTISGKYLLSKKVDSNRVLIPHIEFDVRIDGEGEMNEFGPSTLNLNHREVTRLTEDRVYISIGNFILWNEEGTELSGQYSGAALSVKGDLELHGTIDDGNGKFKNAYGAINITLIYQGKSEYLALVTGKVQIREVKKPTVL